MARDPLTAARAYALFVSDLSARDRPSAAAVTAAIKIAVRAYGVHGCICQVAAAYGEHPETAAPRMRWARDTVEALFDQERPVCAGGSAAA